jgi:hypothetical protein
MGVCQINVIPTHLHLPELSFPEKVLKNVGVSLQEIA